ncbi:MAG: cupredoxin domain-containing protein [Actinomycetota bacterium]
MTPRVTITLIICLAGALTAGIALARPGDAPAVVAAAPAATTEAPRVDGFGNPAPQPGEEGYEDGDGAAPAPAAGAPAEGSITIADFAFGAPIEIAAGGSVSVSNVDGAPHTVTAVDGSFDTGTVDGGGTGSFAAPGTPGTYEFFCAIHPSMTGQLIVS